MSSSKLRHWTSPLAIDEERVPRPPPARCPANLSAEGEYVFSDRGFVCDWSIHSSVWQCCCPAILAWKEGVSFAPCFANWIVERRGICERYWLRVEEDEDYYTGALPCNIGAEGRYGLPNALKVRDRYGVSHTSNMEGDEMKRSRARGNSWRTTKSDCLLWASS